MTFSKKQLTIGGIVGVALLAIIAILVFGNWGAGNNATNLGKKKETALNAQYLDNQNYLSHCLVTVKGLAGTANANADKVNQILSDAIKGRYNDGSSATVGQGQMFSAIIEAYPDLANVSSQYETVAKEIIDCRTDYREKQSLLLDMLREFDSWRLGSRIARGKAAKFPDEDLIARIGSQRYTGEEALEKMYEIVLTSDTIDAYTTGTIPADSGDPFTTTTHG